MATELDPIFVKALKLLHSRSREATEQLKQMTDEAIALRRGELALKKMEDDGRTDDGKHSYKSGPRRDFEKKRETEKRSLEKLKEDLSFLTEEQQAPVKKPKLDVSSDSKHKESSKDRERSRDSSKEKREEAHKPTLKEDPSWLDFGPTDVKNKKITEPAEKRFIIGGTKAGSDSSDEETEGSSFPGLDAEQFATDMMDLACVVCKQIDMTSGNRLLDCQECHRLYHQDCHRPPVSEDVDDPRFVWYCSKCSKNMKKMVKAQKPKSTQASSSRERETTGISIKAFKPEPSVQTPFRRIDTAKSSGSTKDSNQPTVSSSSRPYTGLASLAANLSSKTHESKSRGSESTTKQPATSHSSKVDNSKGLGFLFKPDAHKITNLGTQKSTSSEKGGLYKMTSGTSSSKSSSTGKSSTSSAKPAGMSLLAKSGSGSSSSKTASSSIHSVAKGNSSSASSNSGSSKSMSSSTMMSADKKLQMMKKKAAARAAEKKSFR